MTPLSKVRVSGVVLLLAVLQGGVAGDAPAEPAAAPERTQSTSVRLSLLLAAPSPDAGVNQERTSAAGAPDRSRGCETDGAPISAATLEPMLRRLGAVAVSPVFPGGSPHLRRYVRVRFRTTEEAAAAERLLRAEPGVRIAQVLPSDGRAGPEASIPRESHPGIHRVEPPEPRGSPGGAAGITRDSPTGSPVVDEPVFPDDPYFLSWPGLSGDPQWPLRNREGRPAAGRCGPARKHADLRVDRAWEDLFRHRGSGEVPGPLGSPRVVLGFLDVGVLDPHPDLDVLHEAGLDPRLSVCPGADWCGDHGTKMAGLAAATTGNGEGVAGVCGACGILDLLVSACPCETCDEPEESCYYIHNEWHTVIPPALEADLGMTPSGRRELKVLNASFAFSGNAPLEIFETLWDAYDRGVLVVAGTADHSYDRPRDRSPANLPFVLGVGGHTWEDRFWDASVSCYEGDLGTTIGPGVVSICAPASGRMATTSHLEEDGGIGLYTMTSGQCSAAAALVSGLAGLLQSYALEATTARAFLDPEDLAGVITATARPFSHDPLDGATCPPGLCPRAFYGAGIASAENALFAVHHRDEWEREVITFAEGMQVEPAGSPFRDDHGRFWQEYRVTAAVQIPPRPDLPEAPATLPSFVAWPLKKDSTAPCSYGNLPDRIEYALTGIPDCTLELDRETGAGLLVGANFAELVDDTEIPVVPWEELQMAYAYWAPGVPVETTDDVEARDRQDRTGRLVGLEMLGPNPFRGEVMLRLLVPTGREADCSVFDAIGRLVRRLRTGRGQGRASIVIWDGRDDGGREVPSGIYRVLAASGDARSACAVVRLR